MTIYNAVIIWKDGMVTHWTIAAEDRAAAEREVGVMAVTERGPAVVGVVSTAGQDDAEVVDLSSGR